jgi:hypothetical protein
MPLTFRLIPVYIVQLIDTYNVSKKEVVDLLTAVNAPYTHHDSTRMVKKLQEELDRVCDELMSIELRLNEKFDVLVDDFDNRMAEAKVVSLESQQLFFRAMEVRDVRHVGRGCIQGTAAPMVLARVLIRSLLPPPCVVVFDGPVWFPGARRKVLQQCAVHGHGFDRQANA